MMKQHSGFSLVSTMIGILLGTISILAMMMLYRNVVQQSMTSMVYSREDSEMQSAFFSIQKQLQKAGYGVEAASVPDGTANRDVVVLANASMDGAQLRGTLRTIGTTPVNGNAMVYNWMEGSTSMCSGILAGSDGVQILLPQTCSNASAYASLNWTPYFLAGPKFNATATPINFSVNTVTNCYLYGKVAAGNSLRVGVSSPRSISALGEETAALCLPNIIQ